MLAGGVQNLPAFQAFRAPEKDLPLSHSPLGRACIHEQLAGGGDAVAPIAPAPVPCFTKVIRGLKRVCPVQVLSKVGHPAPIGVHIPVLHQGVEVVVHLPTVRHLVIIGVPVPWVRGVQELLEVGKSIAIGIFIGICGVVGVEAVLCFPEVGHAVLVAVPALEGIGIHLELLEVREAIPVGVLIAVRVVRGVEAPVELPAVVTAVVVGVGIEGARGVLELFEVRVVPLMGQGEISAVAILVRVVVGVKGTHQGKMVV